jgi:hypothetical protein
MVSSLQMIMKLPNASHQSSSYLSIIVPQNAQEIARITELPPPVLGKPTWGINRAPPAHVSTKVPGNSRFSFSLCLFCSPVSVPKSAMLRSSSKATRRFAPPLI